MEIMICEHIKTTLKYTLLLVISISIIIIINISIIHTQIFLRTTIHSLNGKVNLTIFLCTYVNHKTGCTTERFLLPNETLGINKYINHIRHVTYFN